MKDIPQITEAELEVMKVLWELNTATSPEIIEQLSVSSEWKPKTIHTLINRLVAKGAITAIKIDGKSYKYSPSISKEIYKGFANENFLQRLYNGSVHMMLSSFVKNNKLTKTEIEELKRILEEEV